MSDIQHEGDKILHQDAVEEVVEEVLSSAGSPIVRAFPFSFDTPGLVNGVAVWTPAANDLLLDAWFDIQEVWNGTTPFADIGTFAGQTWGWFDDFLPVAVPLDIAASKLSLLQAGAAYGTRELFGSAAVPSVPLPADRLEIRDPSGRVTPAGGPRLLSVDPIKVCVSQNGLNTGADPGSTQGAAVLYLVTCTPA